MSGEDFNKYVETNDMLHGSSQRQAADCGLASSQL